MKTKTTTNRDASSKARTVITRGYIHSLRGLHRGKGLLEELTKEKARETAKSESAKRQIPNPQS